MEDGGEATTYKDGRRVESAKHNFEGHLQHADVEAEPREVQRLLLEEASVAEEVLLELRARGHVGVDDAGRVELEAAHDEAQSEAKACAGSRDQADLADHHPEVRGEEFLGECAVFVEARVQEDLAVLVERGEVADAVKVGHALDLSIPFFWELHHGCQGLF